MGLENMRCDRCKKEAFALSCSMFNTELCCLECIRKEKTHPKYAEAKRIEEEHCKQGNLWFNGIGKPDDL